VRQRLTPYLLGMPGGVYLAVFFVVPLFAVLSVSLQTGNPDTGFTLTWHWHEYVTAISQYHVQFVRSFFYAALSTAFALVLAFPMACATSRRTCCSSCCRSSSRS